MLESNPRSFTDHSHHTLLDLRFSGSGSGIGIIRCLVLTLATIHTKRITRSKTSIAMFSTKDGRRMFAKLARIRGIHDAFSRITFASIVHLSLVSSFLDTITAIEARVRINAIFSTDDKFDFTLKTRVANGTRTVHATHVFLFFKGEGVFIFFQAGEGTEFAFAVLTFTFIVTKEIASPIVSHCLGDGGQYHGQGEQQGQSHDESIYE